MTRKIFIGNLPFEADENTVREIFERIGPVESIHIPLNRETRTPRGFGFVCMCSERDHETALARLHGYACHGRNLVVNEARPREYTHGARG